LPSFSFSSFSLPLLLTSPADRFTPFSLLHTYIHTYYIAHTHTPASPLLHHVSCIEAHHEGESYSIDDGRAKHRRRSPLPSPSFPSAPSMTHVACELCCATAATCYTVCPLCTSLLPLFFCRPLLRVSAQPLCVVLGLMSRFFFASLHYLPSTQHVRHTHLPCAVLIVVCACCCCCSLCVARSTRRSHQRIPLRMTPAQYRSTHRGGA
jgi:hypothetical protein